MSDIETDEARYSRLNTINRDSSNREHSNAYVDEEKGNLLHTNKFQSALSSWHSLYVPRRYVLCIVGFWGFVFIYALRAILSVAIVPMKDEYHYSSSEQGMLLSSFFVGYLFLQVPGGWVASRYGGKWVLGSGVLACGALTLLTPLAAKLNIWAVIILRALEGLVQGVSYPSMHAIFSQWAPPQERSIMTSIVYSGAYMGTVLAFPGGSALADSGAGWPSIFYVFGAVSIAWAVIWLLVIYNKPSDHPSISEKERNFLQDNITPHKEIAFSDVPWGKIVRCLPFWALLVNHTANNWAFYTLLTWMPTYLKDVLSFDIKNAGFIAVLPYLALAGVVIVGGLAADWLIANWLSRTTVRKLFETLGFLIAGAGLIACGFADTVPVAVTFMTIAVGAIGFTNSGFQCNHLDIAPDYAGILMGITNAAATIPGIVSPTLTGFILGDDESDVFHWQIVFYISAAVYVVGIIIWWLFASGEKEIE